MKNIIKAMNDAAESLEESALDGSDDDQWNSMAGALGKALRAAASSLDLSSRTGCHRAHPHEDMSAECEAKTEQAQADAKARLEVADAPPPSEPYPGDATGVGDVVNYTSPTTTGYNCPSATMQVMAVEDVAGYVQAARKQAFEKAMEVIAEHAKAAQNDLASHHDAGAFEAELRLRRAWEAVRAASVNP